MYTGMYVRLSRQTSNRFFFFVSRRNRAILGRQFCMWHSTKLFSIFDLGPLTPKFTPQNFDKIWPISRLVWHIEWRCLCLPGGLRGWPIQWNHAKCCTADPCCRGNDICARPESNRLPACFMYVRVIAENK